jgi:hypothetical protein
VCVVVRVVIKTLERKKKQQKERSFQASLRIAGLAVWVATTVMMRKSTTKRFLELFAAVTMCKTKRRFHPQSYKVAVLLSLC